jgi:hypothetical protein
LAFYQGFLACQVGAMNKWSRENILQTLANFQRDIDILKTHCQKKLKGEYKGYYYPANFLYYN